MDISILRDLTQSTDVKLLHKKTAALEDALSTLQNPPNEPARWAAFMIGMAAACTIEGWVAHDLESESRPPCSTLVRAFLDFCGNAYTESWFRSTPEIVKMLDQVLHLEVQRLDEDGWEEESFEHSYLFRYREFAFDGVVGDEIDGVRISNLPVTPEA